MQKSITSFNEKIKSVFDSIALVQRAFLSSPRKHIYKLGTNSDKLVWGSSFKHPVCCVEVISGWPFWKKMNCLTPQKKKKKKHIMKLLKHICDSSAGPRADWLRSQEWLTFWLQIRIINNSTYFCYSYLLLPELLQGLDEQIRCILNLDMDHSCCQGAIQNTPLLHFHLWFTLSTGWLWVFIWWIENINKHNRSASLIFIRRMTSCFQTRSASRKPSLTGVTDPLVCLSHGKLNVLTASPSD